VLWRSLLHGREQLLQRINVHRWHERLDMRLERRWMLELR